MLLLLLLACGGAPSGETGSRPEAPATHLDSALHPSIATVPLVAWTQEVPAQAVHVEYTFEDQTLSTPSEARDPGRYQVPLFGVPPETQVDWVLLETVDGAQVEVGPGAGVTTGRLPSDLPSPSLVTWDPDQASTEPYLLVTVDTGATAYAGPWWVYIMDRQARVVWYYAVPELRLAVMSRASVDGSHITWGEAAWNGDPPTIERATLDLGWRWSTPTPGIGFTYDEHPDGTLAYDYWTPEEMGIATATPDGTITHVWDCISSWLPSDHSPWDCGTNTITWSEERGTYLYSLYEQDTVIEVDPVTATARASWGTMGVNALLPEGTGFQRQHYPNWTATGTLLVHTQEVGSDRVEWAREFSWDPSTLALTQVWTYAARDVYADCSGEAVRLSNGNTLLNYGCNKVIREVTPGGERVWEVTTQHLVGHQTLLTDLYALNRGWGE